MKNTFVKVLSMMMALMMVVGVFSMITVSAADCAHNDSYVVKVVDPTCVVAGFTRYYCNDCEKEYIDDIKPATGVHVWEDQPGTPANCTEPAYTAYQKCACGAIQGRNPVGESLGGHVFTLTKTVAASCKDNTKGYTVEICARCGAEGTKSNFVEPEHDLQYEVIKHANYSACVSGAMRVTCSACPLSYEIYETNNHDYQEIAGADIDRSQDPFKNVPTVGETCQYEYKNGLYCTICGDYKDMVENNVSSHNLKSVRSGSADYVLGSTIPANKMTDELLAMSWDGEAFGVGTAVRKAATCTAKGYEIKYCLTCQEYKLTEIAKKACAAAGDENSASALRMKTNYYKIENGKLVEIKTLPATTTFEELNEGAYRCEEVFRIFYCNGCKQEAYREVKSAEAHDYDWTVKVGDEDVQMGTVPTPKTCLKNGYTTYTCEFCGETHVTVEVSDVAKGEHTWSATPTGYADTFDCKVDTTWTDAVIHSCTYENCDADNPATPEKEKATDYRDYTGEAKHSYVKQTRAATCISDAAYYNECSRCGFVAEYGDEEGPKDKPAAGFNDKNHVVDEDDQSQAKQLLNTGAAATCTTGQVNTYLCACDTVLNITVDPATSHNETGVFTDLDYDGKVDANEIDAAAFAGNCQNKAVAQGKYCTACAEGKTPNQYVVTVESAIGDKVPTTHTAAGVFVKTVAATCKAKGYDQYYYNCCNGIKDTNFTAEVDPENHKYQEVAKVGQTCYATGTKAHYKCVYCEELFWEEDHDTMITDTDDLIIDQNVDAEGNLGHNWAISNDKVEEKCAAPGVKAHKICTNENCGEYLIEGNPDPVKPVYNEKGEEIAVSAALNILAHDKYYQGWHTGLKETCTNDGYTYKGVYTTVYCCSKCDKVVVPMTNHAGTEVVTPVNYYISGGNRYVVDCTKPTYDLVVCSVCEATYYKNYAKNLKDDHVYTQNDKKQDVADVVGTPSCTEPATDIYYCTICDYEDSRTGAAATGHKINVNGVEIKVNFACDSADHKNYKGQTCVNGCNSVLGNEADFEHEIVPAEDKAPTCTEDGHYAFNYCKDCNKVFGTIISRPATQHANKEFVGVENGNNKYSCPDCQEYILVPIAPVQSVKATVTTNAATATAGDKITATIEISVENTTIKFNVLELVLGSKIGGEDQFDASDIDAVVTGFDTDVEVIASGSNVQIYPADTTELITLASGSKISVTLTLQAKTAAYGDVQITVASANAKTVKNGEVTSTPITITNNAGKVKVSALGNVNGDTLLGKEEINAADYRETYLYAQKVVTGEAEYSVKYDINRDGVVNMTDARDLKTFVLSGKTVADYFALINCEYDELKNITAGASYTEVIGKDLNDFIVINAD